MVEKGIKNKYADRSDCLSDLSYSEPVATLSLGPSFPGSKSPSPLPIPALDAPITNQDVGLLSSSESSSNKENDTPGSQPLGARGCLSSGYIVITL